MRTQGALSILPAAVADHGLIAGCGSSSGRQEAPGRRVDHHNPPRPKQELRVLFYRAAVDLSRQTLKYVTELIRRHRKAIGSAWRLLNPGRQALLVLVYLR